MYLKKLSLVNFKNYAEAGLEFSPKVNCFLGNNGSGKTNLLDAIYYLSFCKSFFNPVDSQNIKKGEAFFVVEGDYEFEGKNERIYCGVKKGQKKQFKRKKKAYEKLADHIGLIPLVMISPADNLLILEGSETRRKFLDGIIAQYDKQYLEHLISYNKALKQRNALLKRFAETGRFDEETLEVWDEQLVRHGDVIFREREKFIKAFTPLFREFYAKISGDKETVSLEYQSKLLEKGMAELLAEARENDRYRQHTTVGVHKDDLVFKVNDFAIKKFGSQGQQKTYLISLKLAQSDFIEKEKEQPPILLLDDIYDKLDDHRVSQLMNIVTSGRKSQVFVTDTDADRLPVLFSKLGVECKTYRIKDGETASHE